MTLLAAHDTGGGEESGPTPDSTWLNADIRAWAGDHGINLRGATTKPDMLAVIGEALA